MSALCPGPKKEVTLLLAPVTAIFRLVFWWSHHLSSEVNQQLFHLFPTFTLSTFCFLSCGMLKNRNVCGAWQATPLELVAWAGMTIFFPGKVVPCDTKRKSSNSSWACWTQHVIFVFLQWLKIRTHSSSWCEGGRTSHLLTHWSLPGGMWAAVVPRWPVPGQWRQWQPGVRLAMCARGQHPRQQPVRSLL